MPRVRPQWYGRSIALILLLFASSTVVAQQWHWDFQEASKWGFDKIAPQVAIDSWGHFHMVWGSKDPNRSGVQLFYSNNTSGIFNSPIQATDTGTVFGAPIETLDTITQNDIATSLIKPFVFRLDSRGAVHIAFVANAGNQLHLFYTNNASGEFKTPLLITDALIYDMAVDSAGNAHVVWANNSATPVTFYYRNIEVDKDPLAIGTIPCVIGPNGCRVGEPEIESSRNGVSVAFRADSGSVYLMRNLSGGPFSQIQKLPAPPYDRPLVNAGRADLRLRMATDSNGAIHILAPHFDSFSRHRLSYISNATGTFTSLFLGSAPIDTIPSAFDLAFNGVNRINAVWTAFRPVRAADLPRVGFAELSYVAAGQQWRVDSAIIDLNGRLATGGTVWKTGARIATLGDRVVISGIRKAPSDSARQQANLIVRTSVRPWLRYIHPDAAAPSMNVVVESYADPRDRGSFGRDGFRGDTVALELINRGDSSRVVVGPSVVSWDGRLVSTMLFVKPAALPSAVPVRLRIGAFYSNVDTFFIVRPQPIGDNGRLSGGGALGSGGRFGARSKRGVMVVESLRLDSGLYSVDTIDIDPATPGNQGFLPVTILSRGPVHIDSTATLSLSGRHDSLRSVFGTAGPGGGGGGTGGEFGGGSGYTAGAGLSRANGEWYRGIAVGTGGIKSGLWSAGPSLNGAAGGGVYIDAPGGGGTGHPFGASGLFGRVSATVPSEVNLGAFGGGSAGTKVMRPGDITSGGGGGSHATAGGSSGDYREINGGFPVGSRQLVPLSGGSGGGGGGFGSGGYASGGGGGGALALFSYSTIQIDGLILANGADGVTASQAGSASGGGGGAGGGVIIGAQGSISFGGRSSIQTKGGPGGIGNILQGGRPGGDGGLGRIRIDGRPVGSQGGVSTPPPAYAGPVTAMSSLVQSRQGAMVTGAGMPGATVRVFARTESGTWNYSSFRETTVGSDSSWSLTLGNEASSGKLYLVAMQRVANPSRSGFEREPDWVMSAAGGNILGRPAVALSTDSVNFAPCIHFSAVDSADVTISNPGYQSDLVITGIAKIGPGASAYRVTPGAFSVASGGSRTFRIYFAPNDTGNFPAELVVRTNAFPDSLRSIRLNGCAISGLLRSNQQEIDLGELCLGDCRDTVLSLRNDGEAPLTVSSFSGMTQDLGVELISPSLPFSIAPGKSESIRVLLCPKRFDGASLLVKANTVDSLLTVVVRATNAGPNFEIPTLIDFGLLELESGDSCVLQTVTVANRSDRFPLRLTTTELLSNQFALIDTVTSDITIEPAKQHTLRVRFCADTAGMFRSFLHMEFGGGNCQLDTSVMLIGEARIKKAQLVLLQPTSRTLILPPSLVGADSPVDTIRVTNKGSAPATLLRPRVAGINGTSDLEIILDSGAVRFPYTLYPEDVLLLTVRTRSASVGPKEGVVVLESTTGTWSETLNIFGQGVKPGLRTSLPRLDFGDVRVGSYQERVLVIDNIGDAPLTLEGVHLSDSVHFQLVDASESLPVELLNGGTQLSVRYRFSPGAETNYAATLELVNNDAPQQVILVGRGVLEHLSGGPGMIDFGCHAEGVVADSVDVVRMTNTGGYPLRIDSLQLSGDPAFGLARETFPHMIPPGESRFYTVKYLAGSGAVSGRIEVMGSAQEMVTIELRAGCGVEEPVLSLSAPHASAYIGDRILLPVTARLNRPLDSDATYSLTLTYAYDLLGPMTAPYPEPESLELVGTLSRSASMTEVKPGELRIDGVIAAGAVSDRLVGIPIKVLRGSTYRTTISFKNTSLLAKGAIVNSLPGSFYAIGCDTSGGIITGQSYALDQNVPNSFNRSTVIRYSIAQREHVHLALYDNMGNPVKVLVDELQSAGLHEYRLESASLPSGIYIYEIRSGRFRKALQMVLME